jgi:hypothetical protein
MEGSGVHNVLFNTPETDVTFLETVSRLDNQWRSVQRQGQLPSAGMVLGVSLKRNDSLYSVCY